jgi:ABC-2 type transport system permease protein
MMTVYKKELSYYLNNPIGYIIVILFGIFANFLFVKDIFVVGSASLRPFFNFLPWLFVVFIPAISMRILSEEKRINTIETLLTLPISETQIVVAKFLAVLSLVFVGLLLTFGLPISLSFVSKLYLPEILVGYSGALLLAAAYVGISMYFSSQTKNQVVAFLASAIFLFVITVMSSDFVAPVLPKFVMDALTYFSPQYHLDNFIKGVIDARSLVYFVSLTALFLFFTVIDLKKRQ